MANFVLNATARNEDKQGKGASRRLRREALVPAIIYGGEAEPVAVTIELRELVKALDNNAFFEEVVEIKLGDKVENVKIQALQRHPAKTRLCTLTSNAHKCSRRKLVSKISLIVGLGNPGTEYAQTRHNAGFWFVEQLADQYHITLKKIQSFMDIQDGAKLKDTMFVF